MPEEVVPCKIWTGALNSSGYGVVSIDGKLHLAHRVAFGPVPDGLEIDHLCGTRCCVERRHLEAVTHSENLRRINGGVCRRGHLYEGNRQVRADGTHYCRPCANERRRERSKK